jgi:hypothetical protein
VTVASICNYAKTIEFVDIKWAHCIHNKAIIFLKIADKEVEYHYREEYKWHSCSRKQFASSL